MAGWQRVLFEWAAVQPGLTGVVLVGAGLVAGLQGFRFYRLLVGAGCGLLGYISGQALAVPVALPGDVFAAAGASVGAAVGLIWPQIAGVMAHGVLWAGLAGYCADQLGLRGLLAIVATVLGGAAGAAMTLVSRQTMIALSTSFFGAGLIIVGLVALASDAFPVVGDTFRAWAQDDSPVVGILWAMLAATVYSYQANARRGDLRIASNAANGKSGTDLRRLDVDRF